MVAGVVAALAASQIVFAANNAPASYGEIYVVSPSGVVKNVTHDPAADVAPAVSPDGRRIAFARQRASSVQIYVVGVDGRRLRAASPRLAGGGLHDGGIGGIVWSPDGRRLAVVRGAALYVGTVGGAWKRVWTQAQSTPAWSPDGARLAFSTTSGLIRVVSPTGRLLWNAGGDGVPAWSRHGWLAVHQNSETVGVYDSNGRQRSNLDGDAFAWSGDRLATLNSGLLALRPTGTGAPSFRVRVYSKSLGPSGGLVWADGDVVRFAARNGWRGYDFARRHALPSTGSFISVFSTKGIAASVVYGKAVSLVRGRKTIRTLPFCNDEESASGLQFVGRTNALVYASGCPEPDGDVYSVAPDGTALRRVTHTGHDDFSPALSPDGTHVAYSEQETASFCKGCSHNLWVTPGVQLTNHADTEDAPFDDDATFSPDGTQIAFDRSGPDSQPALFTIPVTGGAAKSLGVSDAWHPAWGPRGVAFVRGYRPATIGLVDPVTRAVTTLGTEPKLDVQALAWSGDKLAYLSPGRITVVGGRTIHLAQQRVTGLAWSPDGTRFAYVAPDANGWGEVWTIRADGTGVRRVTRNLGVVGNLSWR